MRAYFSGLKEEYVSFAKKTVSFRSYPGEEKPLADFFLDAFEKMGVEAFRDGAGNVIAVLKGEGGGPNVMLNGHLDIVPEGDLKNWAPFDPFSAELDGDELVGRGLSDLKGGLCAQFFAFREFARLAKKGKKLPGDLIFALVTMEEPAESMGTEYLFDVTMKERGLTCDAVYLSEPTSGDLALGHRGKVELVVDVFGRTAHSSQPKQGISAVEKALPLLSAVFDAFGEPADAHPLLGESSMTVTDLEIKPGGLSVVPDLCRVYVDRRYVPPKTTADCVAQIERFIAARSEKDPEFSAKVYPRATKRTCYTGYTKEMERKHPVWITDREDPFVQASFKALREIGQDPAEKYWKFGTDGSITKGACGIPTIGYSMAEERWAHQPKERVNVDRMLLCVEGYCAMLCALYGLPLSEIAGE